MELRVILTALLLVPLTLFSQPQKKNAPVEAQFQGGRAEETFAAWLHERLTASEAASAIEAVSQKKPLHAAFFFTIDETGKLEKSTSEPSKELSIAVVGDEAPYSDLRAALAQILDDSPTWEPAYKNAKRKKVVKSNYYILFGPAEGAIEVDKVTDDDYVMASFEGGDLSAFRRWFSQQLVFPEGAVLRDIEGRVVVKFYVERDGSVTFGEVLESPLSDLAQEVTKVLLRCPRWTPATFKGIPGRLWYLLPVKFKFQEEKASSLGVSHYGR